MAAGVLKNELFSQTLIVGLFVGCCHLEAPSTPERIEKKRRLRPEDVYNGMCFEVHFRAKSGTASSNTLFSFSMKTLRVP